MTSAIDLMDLEKNDTLSQIRSQCIIIYWDDGNKHQCIPTEELGSHCMENVSLEGVGKGQVIWPSIALRLIIITFLIAIIYFSFKNYRKISKSIVSNIYLTETYSDEECPLIGLGRGQRDYSLLFVLKLALAEHSTEYLLAYLSRRYRGITRLHQLVWNIIHVDVLEILMKRLPSDAKMELLMLSDDIGDFTPLHAASITENGANKVRALLNTLDIDKSMTLLSIPSNSTGFTPLHIAAQYNKGADELTAIIENLDGDQKMTLLSLKCKLGFTPLHYAVQTPNAANKVKALLDTLAIDERLTLLSLRSDDKISVTPVHFAARLMDSGDALRALFKTLEPEMRMKLLTIKSHFGTTPVHYAALNQSSSEIMRATLETLNTNQRYELLGVGVELDAGSIYSAYRGLLWTPVHVAAHSQQNPDVIVAMLESLDYKQILSLLGTKDVEQCTPLHIALEFNSAHEVIGALLDTLQPEQRVSLLCQMNDQQHTPVTLAVRHNENSDVIQKIFEDWNCEQKKLLLYPEDDEVISPLKLAVDLNSNLGVSRALFRQVPKHEKIRILMAQGDGKASPDYAETASHMAIMREDDMVMKIEYLNLQYPSRRRLLHVCVMRKYFLLVISFLSNNEHIDIAPCLSVLIAAKTANIDLDVSLIKQIQSLKEVSSIGKKYIDLLSLYMETADMDTLCILLDHLACYMETDHHVLLWKDGMDNTLLHLSAKSSSKRFIYKAITSQLRRETNEALESKNTDGLTPYCLAKNRSIRNVLAWTEAQSGSYLLLTPPRAIIFYSDVNRWGARDEKDSFVKAMQRLGITPDTVQNPTLSDIYGKIAEGLRGEVSALIVAVFSHGDSGTVNIGGGPLSINVILKQMNREKHGIPKILIVQACQEKLTVTHPKNTPTLMTVSNQGNVDASIVTEDACIAEHDAKCIAKPRVQAITWNQRGDLQGESAIKHFDIPGPDMCVLAATINHQFSVRNLMIPLLSQNLGKANAGEDLHQIFLRTIDEVRHQEPSQVPEYRSTMRFKLCLKNTFNEDLEYQAPPV